VLISSSAEKDTILEYENKLATTHQKEKETPVGIAEVENGRLITLKLQTLK
jgi:hypothetical protein